MQITLRPCDFSIFDTNKVRMGTQLLVSPLVLVHIMKTTHSYLTSSTSLILLNAYLACFKQVETELLAKLCNVPQNSCLDQSTGKQVHYEVIISWEARPGMALVVHIANTWLLKDVTTLWAPDALWNSNDCILFLFFICHSSVFIATTPHEGLKSAAHLGIKLKFCCQKVKKRASEAID